MNKQALRNWLRFGGIIIAIVGFVLRRSGASASMDNTGRVLMWVGVGMIVLGIFVQLFVREP